MTRRLPAEGGRYELAARQVPRLLEAPAARPEDDDALLVRAWRAGRLSQLVMRVEPREVAAALVRHLGRLEESLREAGDGTAG